MKEACTQCGAQRPPRNEYSRTKAYKTFQQWAANITLSDAQIQSWKGEVLEQLRAYFDGGADMGNFSIDGHTDTQIAELTDTLGLMNRLREAEDALA